jgi:hypothetical protein
MPLFLATWKCFNCTRSDCFTYFATIYDAAMEADKGPEIVIRGRWHEIGNCAGAVIAEAPNANSLYTWVFNWSETNCSVDVKAICDDNATREIVLRAGRPPWRANYDNIGDEPREGESLYMASFEFYPEHKMTAYTTFANLSEEQDKADSGACRNLGRYHDLGTGSGIIIAAAKSEKDLYAWAFNWAPVCKVKIVPVLTDKDAQALIKAKPGFDKKVAALMATERAGTIKAKHGFDNKVASLMAAMDPL